MLHLVYKPQHLFVFMPKLVHVPASAKVIERWPIIAKGMVEGKTAQVLADELGVSAWTIYQNMKNPEFQAYLDNAITESFMPMIFKQAQRLEELWNSKDPRDRRTAFTEGNKIIQRIQGTKVYQRTENLNLTMSQDRTDFRELMELATPEEQQVIIRLFNRAREHKKAPTLVDATVNFLEDDP